ncbi:ATP-dependent nuclease [Faecalibaculum rodentium]|jgi:putative ATP-dependent endonuclease of OLD family|uniref:ATP-dependent nuclease n=4 Tax=Faecalibaculum rodentium TaxID=1702221 RepID=UPI00255AA6B6|nr:AAA family ATPase [Faecalibaculum rodentium]
MIETIVIKNYKIFDDLIIEFDKGLNILVGDNDSGKSTILEVISILTSGNLNNYPLDRQLKPSFFNQTVRKNYIESIKRGSTPPPPKIILEAYLSKDDDPTFSGTNNELKKNCPGIRVTIEFDNSYASEYKQMIQEESIHDIPIELYKVTYSSFASATGKILFRNSPIKSILIDATHKNYSYMIDRFIGKSINDTLNGEEIISLSKAYRQNKTDFKENSIIENINRRLAEYSPISHCRVSIGLQEERVDAWKNQMTIMVKDIPLENIGFGTQNIIKSELALSNCSDSANIILFEEPENSLSHTNLAKLVSAIESTENKQIFITTHSSYIANRLNLNNLIFVNGSNVSTFRGLDTDTASFFKVLPGSDTLRIVIASKVILVEGPSDSLIIQRAYKDKKISYQFKTVLT